MHFAIKRKKNLHFRMETFMNWFIFHQEWNQVMSKEYLGTENNPTSFNCHLLSAKRQDWFFFRSGHILCLLLFQKERENILLSC